MMVNSMNETDLDLLKNKYVNSQHNDFTIIDIFIEDNVIKCRCKCSCENIKDYPLKYIIKGRSKSCGHRRSTDAPKKISEWRKNNPDKLIEISNKIKKWNEKNNEILLERNMKNSLFYKNLRTATDFTELFSIIHPDYINDLLSGKLDTHSIIKTKCPICGEYCEHVLNNVFRIKTGKLKNGRAPYCHNCRPVVSASSRENELYEFISSFYNGICIRNYRDLLYPYEVDLYYPDKKIAVEFNGDYWHSRQNGKPDNYHYRKFKECLSKGILLVSVFESAWNNNANDIKNYIHDLFSRKENKLSYRDDSCINNNYPPYNVADIQIGDYISEYYTTGKYVTFTCGFSKIKD